jgi:hypothetical protein
VGRDEIGKPQRDEARAKLLGFCAVVAKDAPAT